MQTILNMINVSKEKYESISKMLELTQKQAQSIDEDNYDLFDSLNSEKQKIIESINKYDEDFLKNYDEFKKMDEEKLTNEEKILANELRNIVTKILDIMTKIQSLEDELKEKMDRAKSEVIGKINEYKSQKKGYDAYFKYGMDTSSYFDEKK